MGKLVWYFTIDRLSIDCRSKGQYDHHNKFHSKHHHSDSPIANIPVAVIMKLANYGLYSMQPLYFLSDIEKP